MQVATIDIDRDEARKRIEQFTTKRRRKLTEMDQALYRGYKALAEGLTLIDVNQAIKQGGHFEDNDCPKLAIARSDVETVHFDHIKRHYYMTHGEINPTRLVPLGPTLNLAAPHHREKISAG